MSYDLNTADHKPEDDLGCIGTPVVLGKKLIAYPIVEGEPMLLQPSNPKRVWMEATKDRLAYRCLPLIMANQIGWTLANPISFEAMWDGSDLSTGITIRSEKDLTYVHVNFGYGVISLLIPYLFRTEAGYNLFVRGPSNRPKDAIQPLEGLVESDWITATFTMNWKFTRPNKWVKFSAGEPICLIVPMRRGELEEFTSTIEVLEEEAELEATYRLWQSKRAERFQMSREELEQNGQWQLHYFRGYTIDGKKADEHQSKLNLAPFHRKVTD